MRFTPITPDQASELSRTAGVPLTSDLVGASVLEGDDVLATVMLCNFTQNSCWIHLVVYDSKIHEANWFADEVLGFTFGPLRRRMLLTTTSSVNEGSLALQKGYGFKEVARIPNGVADGEDLVISQLTAEDYLDRRAH